MPMTYATIADTEIGKIIVYLPVTQFVEPGDMTVACPACGNEYPPCQISTHLTAQRETMKSCWWTLVTEKGVL